MNLQRQGFPSVIDEWFFQEHHPTKTTIQTRISVSWDNGSKLYLLGEYLEALSEEWLEALLQ